MSTATTAPIAIAMQQDPSIVVLGECFSLSEADDALHELHPDRHFLLPAADSTLAGIAFGMAIDGSKTIVRLPDTQSLLRLWPALAEQQMLQSGSTVMIYELPCAPSDGSAISELSTVNKMNVWAAITHHQHQLVLQKSIKAGNTVMLSCLVPDQAPEPSAEGAEEPAPWLTIRAAENPWATLVCWGHGTADALAVAAEYAAEECELEVIALQQLTPSQASLSTLGQQLSRSGRLIAIELPSAVQQALLSEAFWSLEAPPQSCKRLRPEIRQALDEALRY